jgi:hypothetical protein
VRTIEKNKCLFNSIEGLDLISGANPTTFEFTATTPALKYAS